MKRWTLSLLGLMVGCGDSADVNDVNSSSEPEQPSSSAPSTEPEKKPATPQLKGQPAPEEITEKYGVFVSPAGRANGEGTRERPLASIGAAIEKAKDGLKRVYVCEGTYAESLVLVTGISVVGGLDCTTITWRQGRGMSRIESKASPAIRATDITTATRLEGLDVVAPDGTADSPSSIGMIAERAGALTIARSKITSGKGAKGADGVEGVQLVPNNTPPGNGQPGDGPRERTSYFLPLVGGGEWVREKPASAPPAPGGISRCEGAPGHDGEAGGAGSRAGTFTYESHTVTVALGSEVTMWSWDPLAGTPAAAAPQVRSTTARTPGASGGVADGSLDASGYSPRDGQVGADGLPGQGGSGGASGTCAKPTGDKKYICIPPSGGGGGAGGCPGLAGTPGKGGGASIAALVLASDGLTFEQAELVAGDGGAGGKGTFGSAPTAGGAGGTAAGGSPGLRGGDGGRAGISSSGAGGPSYGLAFSGTQPKLDATAPKAGTGGAGVAEEPKEIFGLTTTLPATPAGDSKDLYGF